jgi:TolB-like protein/DNA-binding winged helix-turn-helix (wHTH) protein/cytochrome c-type biogenesis protein CcmH/NrfG
MSSGNQPTTVAKVARFGAYEADPRSGELRKSGMRLKIGVQPFQVLAILLEKRGDIVTRDELREQIWPSGTFVDFENGLNKAVAKLRGVLNDDPANPRFIETVPRRGYRFLAPVEFVETGDSTDAVNGDRLQRNFPNTSLPEQRPVTESRDRNGGPRDTRSEDEASAPGLGRPGFEISARLIRRTAWACLGIGLITGAVILYSQRHSHQRELKGTIHSIAVLPFDNVSGDSDQQYLAAGMTDEMLKNLGRIATLRVVSAASAARFKHTGEPPTQIGREMGVDAVIEGNSARAGDKVRLTVKLFSVSDNEYVWAGDFTSNVRQLLAAQDEITQTIAQQIRLQFATQDTPSKTKHVPTPEAYEAYLEGRYYYYHWGGRWTLAWWKKSCENFQRAIQLDPEYAPAYAGLAECFNGRNGMGMEVPEKDRVGADDALAMARKAVQLDDTLADAHAALGMIYLNNWRWPEAGEELKKAVELQPNDPQLHFRLANYYRTVGNLHHAMDEAQEAKRLDPGSASMAAELGWMYFQVGDETQAEKEFKNAMALEPVSVAALRGLFEIYDHQHKRAEAMATFADFVRATRHEDRARKMLEIYRNQGYENAVQYELREEIQDDYSTQAKPFYFAADYARLGEREKALAYLEQAYAGHAPQLKGLKTNRDFASVSADPRFQSILKKIGLDDASLAALN